MPVPFSRILFEKIKALRFLSLAEVHELAEKHGRKQSTAERVLRSSNAPPFVMTVYNKKDQVVGYKYKKVIC